MAKKVFLSVLPPRSQLPAERCSKLWADLEEKLVAQRQQAQAGTKVQLEDMRAQVDQEWTGSRSGIGDSGTS